MFRDYLTVMLLNLSAGLFILSWFVFRHLDGDRAREVRTLSVRDGLGYDTVRGDPHGSWGFAPTIFAQIGRLLAGCGLPVCVVQEGGYALGALAACSYAFAAGLLDEAVVPA